MWEIKKVWMDFFRKFGDLKIFFREGKVSEISKWVDFNKKNKIKDFLSFFKNILKCFERINVLLVFDANTLKF